MFSRLLGFFFCAQLAFTGLVNAADPEGPVVAPPEPSRSLTPIKLVVELPPEVLAGMTSLQREQFEAEKARIAEVLFLWGNFQVELPRPVYQPGVQIIEIAPLTTVDAAGHVRRLALTGDGARKKLNPRQWAELRQDSIFSVEDPQNPGQFDVWKVTSGLVHKGTNEIRITLRKGLANALDHLMVGLPNALVGEDVLSVKKGIRNILFGLRNSLSLIVGLTENNPRYTPEQITALVQAERAKVAGGTHPNPAKNHPNADLLADEALLEKALPLIQSIQADADQKWMQQIQSFRFAIEQQLQARGTSSEKSPQEFRDAYEFSRMNVFFQALLDNQALKDLNPRLAAALVQHGKVKALIEATEHEIHRRVQAHRQEREAYYKQKNPVLSQVKGMLEKWVEGDAKAFYLSIRDTSYESLARTLAEQGYAADARALLANLDFISGDETTVWGRLLGRLGGEQAEMRRMLADEKVPAKKYEHPLRIWSAKNWILQQSEAADGTVTYSAQKYAALPDVYSNLWFWRLANAGLRTATAFKLGLYGLVYRNFIQGPLGIKSLALAEPFEFIYLVDPATGKVVADPTQKMGTLWSRALAGEEQIRKLLADFKASEDTGMISKRIYGPLYVFWHGFVRRIFQPLILGSLQVGATAANTVVTAAGILTSPVWAPMAAFSALGFEPTIFDFDAPRVGSENDPAPTANRTTNRLFPLVSELLGRAAVPGVPSTLGGASKALLWNPEMAMGVSMASYTRSLAARLRDWTTRGFLWLLGARIPAKDPTFLFHRTQGDGVTDGYFFQIDSESALAAILAKLEITELTEYEARMKALIALPEAKARELFEPLSLLITGFGRVGFTEGSPVYGPVYKAAEAQSAMLRAAVAEREAKLAALFPPTPAPLKMNQKDLEEVLSHGSAVVEIFFTSRVFSELSAEKVDEYWSKQGLTRHDWRGLTRRLLVDAYGEAILTPIEITARSFRRTLAPVGMSEMVNSVLTGNALPLEGRDTAEWNSERIAPMPDPRFKAPTAQQLCAASLADFGKGMTFPPPPAKPTEVPLKEKGVRRWFIDWMKK